MISLLSFITDQAEHVADCGRCGFLSATLPAFGLKYNMVGEWGASKALVLRATESVNLAIVWTQGILLNLHLRPCVKLHKHSFLK